MSVHTSSVYTFVDLLSNIMRSHIIVIEPDLARILLISHYLYQSRTISPNLMSFESYCLGYSPWSHDTIVLDPMSVSLITCDLGVSREISRNLVMIETCFASFVHQHYGCELNSLLTSYVHVTCVSRLVISLYLAVSQLDLDVSWSYTHHMNVTDVHMSAHSSSTADASLDVEPNLIFIISIFLIVLSVIRLTAYGVMYVIHIASHTLCDGATYLSRVPTYHVTPRVMLFLCLLSHVTVVAGTPADDTCPNLDDLHDMFIGMVYSHGYANVLMALSAAAAVAVSMADSYYSHDSTRSMRTIISALATATATAASIAGCPAAKLDDMDAEHALLADASDAEPAWLTDAAYTLMHTLHVSAADGSAADPADDVAAAASIADTDAAAAVAAPAAAATTFAVAAVAAPAAVIDDAADDTDAASTVSSLDTAVSSVALHTSDMRARTQNPNMCTPIWEKHSWEDASYLDNLISTK